MSNVVTINDTQIEQLTYHGQPVVTFEMIAKVHSIPVSNVQKSFQRHQERFTDGKHVHRIDHEEVSQLGLSVLVSPNGLRLFTEKGYLLLVKPMKDEASWQVQERMIDEYFVMRKTLLELPTTRGDLLVQMAEGYRLQEQKLLAIEAEQSAQKDELIATQQHLLETYQASQRAESKADMALDEAHRMTIEEFILINGLIRQFPHTKHAEYARWLGGFCIDYGLDVRKAPVLGKSWDKELAYPLQALAAWYRYEQKRPQQITLANRPHTGA